VSYGPWSPAVEPVERAKQLRSLQALVLAFVRPTEWLCRDTIVRTLRQAEHDGNALKEAREQFEQIPALTKRRLLSVFGAATWPTKPRRPDAR